MTSYAAEDRAELGRVEMGDGPAVASNMPSFVMENVAFGILMPEQRTAWFTIMGRAAKDEGCVFLRYSVDNDRMPKRGLVEGWQAVQDPYRLPPVQWPRVDRMPIEGVVSATEDVSAMIEHKPEQEIRW